MDFALSPDQEALREGVRSFCESRLSIPQLRELEKAGVDRKLWSDYAEMGVLGLRVPESAGGVGLGMAEAVLVFEELGRCVAPGPLLWSHLVADRIEGVESGEVVVTGLDLRRDVEGPHLVEHLDLADVLLLIREDGVERIDRSALRAEKVSTPLDPFTPVSRVETLPAGERIGDGELARTLVLEGTVLVAATMLGVAEAAQAEATAYAAERRQFDRSIGSFQAIKHMLADCFVRQELARASVYAAGVLLDGTRGDEAERAALGAGLICEEAAMKNARTCIQVHGGMGFTWENPSHYYLKRTWVLENALGRSSDHAEHLAQHVAAAISM